MLNYELKFDAIDSSIDNIINNGDIDLTSLPDILSALNGIKNNIGNIKSMSDNILDNVISDTKTIMSFGQMCGANQLVDLNTDEFYNCIGAVGEGNIMDSIGSLTDSIDFDFSIFDGMTTPEITGSSDYSEYLDLLQDVADMVSGKYDTFEEFSDKLGEYSSLNSEIVSALSAVGHFLSCGEELLTGLNKVSNIVGVKSPALNNTLSAVNDAKAIGGRSSQVLTQAKELTVGNNDYISKTTNITNSLNAMRLGL
jgi:hypothetical protein